MEIEKFLKNNNLKFKIINQNSINIFNDDKNLKIDSLILNDKTKKVILDYFNLGKELKIMPLIDVKNDKIKSIKLINELNIFLAKEYENGFKYFDYNKEDYELAIQNLKRLKIIDSIKEISSYKIYFLKTENKISSSIILNNIFLKDYINKNNIKKPLIIMPSKDKFVMCDFIDEKSYKIMQSLALDFYEKSNNKISPFVFIYDYEKNQLKTVLKI